VKLGLGLGEPHFGILDPKVREFNGNVSDWGGNDGGGLGSQRGDDRRIDLFRHPKNKRKCGLELE
jgi:hypothetical protein